MFKLTIVIYIVVSGFFLPHMVVSLGKTFLAESSLTTSRLAMSHPFPLPETSGHLSTKIDKCVESDLSAAMEANPPSETTESARNSHMVMQWGQLVDHDILATAGEFFDCCQNDIK